MNQPEILKKIGGIIAELKDQYTYLNTAESGFNDLELELFMANAHFLTDHICILQKINQQPVIHSPAIVQPILQLEEIAEKPLIPDYFAAQDLLAMDPIPFKTPETTTEIPADDFLPVKEAIILPEVMPEEAQLPHETFVLPEVFPQTETIEPADTNASFINPKLASEPDFEEENFEPKTDIGESFITRPETISLNSQPHSGSDFSISSGNETEEPAFVTLNDRIAAQNGLNQSKLKTENQPKTNQDLQSMISLNDKLLFVKELFNGYNLAYAEAINILNRYDRFEQAESFLNQNYAAKNSWKDKPLTTEKMMDLLRRRFA